MIAVSVESTWPRRRWLTGILLVMALQIIFIFALAGRKTTVAATTSPEARVYLPANSRPDLTGITSPTLFILANRRGFSGRAWMEVPSLPYELPKWIDPAPPVVTNPIPRLAGTLSAYVQTNLNSIFELIPNPAPAPDIMLPFENPGVAQSTLTIEGELARRPLLTKFQLPSWPASEILTDSVVLAGVDQAGNVFSAVVLADGKSGSKDADANALRQVSAARFQSLRSENLGQPSAAESRLHWGRFIFHWNTVAPAAVSNNPATNPSSVIPVIAPHD